MSALFALEELTVRIGTAQIVSGISWGVAPGETLGIVGESGSGKSMSVLAATGLVPRPPAVIGGRALLGDGDQRLDLLAMSPRQLQQIRGRRIGFVFQDPANSLNPLLTVEKLLCEPMRAHLDLDRPALRRRALELLELVGIPDPTRRLKAYPHELSGGMRQRVMIAIALSCDPEVLIADEPTTALDVTIQAQIISVIRDLQERLGTAVVWISHDLGVIGGIADNVVVCYGGQVVEEAPMDVLHRRHRHPYTRGLFAARPTLGEFDQPLSTIPGSPPDPRNLPPGCIFWERCDVRSDPSCATDPPALAEVAADHRVRTRCVLPETGPVETGPAEGGAA